MVQARATSQLSRFWLPQLNFQESGSPRVQLCWQKNPLSKPENATYLARKCITVSETVLLCLYGARFLEVWILLKQNLFTRRSKWKDADRGLLCLRRALQSADGHIPSDSHEYRIIVLICFAGACVPLEVLFILILWTLDCL